jgi:hypothetical protein
MLPLEAAFHDRMLEIYERASSECDYRPTYFRNMVNELGGLGAARKLLRGAKESAGFLRLCEGRLDLSVEAVILEAEWSQLFSDSDRELARARLPLEIG